jgi:hypothetical protein
MRLSNSYHNKYSELWVYLKNIHKVYQQKYSVFTVRYHEDRCTKKSHVWSPTLGLFLTCTENSFYSRHILIKWMHICCLLKEVTCLERQSLFHGGKFPIHSGPLLKVSCPFLMSLAFPSPPAPPPAYRAFISLHKDDTNKPDSSVGHNHFPVCTYFPSCDCKCRRNILRFTRIKNMCRLYLVILTILNYEKKGFSYI